MTYYINKNTTENTTVIKKLHLAKNDGDFMYPRDRWWCVVIRTNRKEHASAVGTAGVYDMAGFREMEAEEYFIELI